MKALVASRAFRVLLQSQWRRNPAFAFLIVAGVALGVAMASSIDIASASALKALEYSTQTLRGPASHVITARPARLPWQVYVDLRTRLGVRNSAPVVTDRVEVAAAGGQARFMTLVGIDPMAEMPYRSWLGTAGSPEQDFDRLRRFISTPYALLIGARTAERLDLDVGSPLTLTFQGRNRTFQVVGIAQANARDAGRYAADALVTDIAHAMAFLERPQVLDRIDLFLDPAAAAQALPRLQEALPAAAYVEEAGQTFEAIRRLTRAFRINLGALSLLAAVVGTFLIYNALSFNVLKSRRALGMLRALGMTRVQIFALVMAEALALGAAGSGAGLVAGRLLAEGMVNLIVQSYGDLYFLETVRSVRAPAWVAGKGVLLGLGCALLGAGAPAWEAARTEVAHVMRSWGVASERQSAWKRSAAVGGACVAVGGLLLLPAFPLAVTFGGIFLALVGISFLVPACLQFCARRALQGLAGRSAPFLKMALRQPLRRLEQTSVAVAALMLSLSVVIGVGAMVGSFRASVEAWLDQVVQADIYVASAATHATPFLPPGSAPAIASWPAVARVNTILDTEAQAPELGRLNLVVLSGDEAKFTRRYTSRLPSAINLWDAAVQQDALMINEPMARRHGLAAGDRVTLVTRQGPTSFLIAGVFAAYDAVPVLLMARAVYRKFWASEDVTGLSVTLRDARRPEAALSALAAYFHARAWPPRLLSNRELRREALATFDRTFAVTGALQALAMCVSFMSVLASVMGLMLDQAREFATLRAVGATKFRMGQLLVMESGLFGLSATALAFPVGTLLSFVLIYVVNVRSFGWSLDWSFQPLEFGKAAAVGLAAALLASAYPIWHLNARVLGQAQRLE